MSSICPKGHFSTDPDYCSECGSRLGVAAAPSTAGSASADGADRCPDCGTSRPADARFCEVCRFNFSSRTSFNGLAPAPAPAPAPATSAPVAPAQPPAPLATALAASAPSVIALRLRLRVVVDATLNQQPDPDEPCPQNMPEKVFHLDLDENTLGRQYEGKGGHPEFVVHDPGISRRHLKFIRDPSGGYAVLELGSVNGTELNGKPLETGVVTPVTPGDQLTLGMWTRVRVEER
jgi:hypothetical protein